MIVQKLHLRPRGDLEKEGSLFATIVLIKRRGKSDFHEQRRPVTRGSLIVGWNESEERTQRLFPSPPYGWVVYLTAASRWMTSPFVSMIDSTKWLCSLGGTVGAEGLRGTLLRVWVRGGSRSVLSVPSPTTGTRKGFNLLSFLVSLMLVLGADRCKPTKTAYARCIALLTIGKCERWCWKAMTKRPCGDVGLCRLCFMIPIPSLPYSCSIHIL